MPVPYCFDYYSIVISLKSGRVILPALFFLRITLAIAFGYFANDAEHLFNMLYIPSLVKYLFVPLAHFLIGFFFKLLSVQFFNTF